MEPLVPDFRYIVAPLVGALAESENGIAILGSRRSKDEISSSRRLPLYHSTWQQDAAQVPAIPGGGRGDQPAVEVLRAASTSRRTSGCTRRCRAGDQWPFPQDKALLLDQLSVEAIQEHLLETVSIDSHTHVNPGTRCALQGAPILVPVIGQHGERSVLKGRQRRVG